MVPSECVALEGVDTVMELLSEEGRRPCRTYMILGGEDCRRCSGFELSAVRVLRRLGTVSSALCKEERFALYYERTAEREVEV